MKLLTRLLTRYWGYLALAIAIFGYLFHGLGFAAILALSLAALGYFLLQAPMYCGAETRTRESCRNNSHGLLRGCSLRQHKWQRVQQAFTPAGGRAVFAAGKSAGGFLAAARRRCRWSQCAHRGRRPGAALITRTRAARDLPARPQPDHPIEPVHPAWNIGVGVWALQRLEAISADLHDQVLQPLGSLVNPGHPSPTRSHPLGEAPTPAGGR
jgi:hypothetical protein